MSTIGTATQKVFQAFNNTAAMIPAHRFVQHSGSASDDDILVHGARMVPVAIQAAAGNRTMGVTVGPIDPGAYGTVIYEGVALIETDGSALTEGMIITSSVTTGQADESALAANNRGFSVADAFSATDNRIPDWFDSGNTPVEYIPVLLDLSVSHLIAAGV